MKHNNTDDPITLSPEEQEQIRKIAEKHDILDVVRAALPKAETIVLLTESHVDAKRRGRTVLYCRAQGASGKIKSYLNLLCLAILNNKVFRAVVIGAVGMYFESTQSESDEVVEILGNEMMAALRSDIAKNEQGNWK